MSLLDLDELVLPPAWHRDAACQEADPELFFPERGDSTRPAKLICSKCPVQLDCLRDALETGEKWGIRGGMSPLARKRYETSNRGASRNDSDGSQGGLVSQSS